MTDTAVSCCGKKVKAGRPKKASAEDKLHVEMIENDFFITSEHPMTKEHSITFVALLTNDSMTLRKLYPEWGLQVRIPVTSHGRLLWYCTQHGLFYQDI